MRGKEDEELSGAVEVDKNGQPVVRKKLGRPKGSKNKPKGAPAVVAPVPNSGDAANPSSVSSEAPKPAEAPPVPPKPPERKSAPPEPKETKPAPASEPAESQPTRIMKRRG